MDGCTVSPRKSRRKSPCFSSTVTSTPARASNRASTIPAGPPPTTQQVVRSTATAPFAGIGQAPQDVYPTYTADARDGARGRAGAERIQ
ncbi:hypothetical protein GCM10010343_36110 [Streptomyces avidinii]|nr:hypothetical protein GCM10010343_36110 [Streptomyces avidinii]